MGNIKVRRKDDKDVFSEEVRLLMGAGELERCLAETVARTFSLSLRRHVPRTIEQILSEPETHQKHASLAREYLFTEEYSLAEESLKQAAIIAEKRLTLSKKIREDYAFMHQNFPVVYKAILAIKDHFLY